MVMMAVVTIIHFQSPQVIRLHVHHDLTNTEIAHQIEIILQEYSDEKQTNIHIDFSMFGTNENINPDVHILRQFPENPSGYTETPIAWSGRLWMLGIHTDALQILGSESPQLSSKLQQGDINLAEFETAMQILFSKDITPITLGNSHGWPYVLWLQFVTASMHGGFAAQTFPFVESLPESVIAAKDKLTSWRELGYFNQDVWTRGWAAGLAPLTDGSAALTILNETMLTALPPQHRAEIVFVPFPNESSIPWTIGSAHYLGVLRSSRNKRQAQSLVTHLTSPEITARLSRITGRPFFAWQAQDTSTNVLDAWIDRANTPELNALARWAVD